MQRRVGQVLAAVVSFLVFGSAAEAVEVLLVRPATSDLFVDELFHRVGGELSLHAFSVRQEEGTAEVVSLSEAQALLTRTGAGACVSFIARTDISVVRVWIAAADAAPQLFEAVSLHRTPDVPTVLAARAVDLLTTALDARRPAVSPPVAAPPETAVDAVTRADRTASPASLWVLSLGSLIASGGDMFTVAAGPEIAVVRALSPRLAAGLRVAGPLWGARHDAVDAHADLLQGRALLHLQATIGAWRALSARLRAGAGAHYVRVAGRVADDIGSFAPATDQGWTAAAVVGIDVALALSPRIAIGVGGDAGLLWPRPRIEVGRDTVRFDQLRPSLTLDVRFNL